MTKKIVFLLTLFLSLIGVICFEQVYTENALSNMTQKVDSLQASINSENLSSSKEQIDEIISIWKEKEKVICLFVDYRDIEQIGKQANLVDTHLINKDFELAKVECSALKHAINNFSNMVKFDFFNIF